MKLLLIANTIYLPIASTNKYIMGSVSGNLFFDKIFTREEIDNKHKESLYPLMECDNLRDLCIKWSSDKIS